MLVVSEAVRLRGAVVAGNTRVTNQLLALIHGESTIQEVLSSLKHLSRGLRSAETEIDAALIAVEDLEQANYLSSTEANIIAAVVVTADDADDVEDDDNDEEHVIQAIVSFMNGSWTAEQAAQVLRDYAADHLAAISPRSRAHASGRKWTPPSQDDDERSSSPDLDLEMLLAVVDDLENRSLLNSAESNTISEAIVNDDNSALELLLSYVTGDLDEEQVVEELRTMADSYEVQGSPRAQAGPGANAGPRSAAELTAEEISRLYSGAHAELVSDMRSRGVISGADATVLRRLFASGDDAVLAAWAVLAADPTQDLSEVEDTLLELVARDQELSAGSDVHLQQVLRGLANLTIISGAEASLLEEAILAPNATLQLANSRPTVRDAVAACVRHFSSDRDADRLGSSLSSIAWTYSKSLGSGPESAKQGSGNTAGGSASMTKDQILAVVQSLVDMQQLSQEEGEGVLRGVARGSTKANSIITVCTDVAREWGCSGGAAMVTVIDVAQAGMNSSSPVCNIYRIIEL